MFSDQKYSFSVCQKYFFVISKKVNIFHRIEPTYVFNLYCSKACSIEESKTVTITGGHYSNRRVTQYKVDGSSQSLPNLNHGRNSHACGVFTNNWGSTV